MRQVLEAAGAYRSVAAITAFSKSAGATETNRSPEIRGDTEDTGCFPLVGVGVNCCHPEHAMEAAQTIARVLEEFEWS